MTRSKIDIKEHFIIPEGYFDNFTEQMMSKLPEQPFQPVRTKRRFTYLPQISAAVAAVAIILVSVITVLIKSSTQDIDASAQANSLNDIKRVNGVYSVEDAADCAMIDRLEMYEMITE